HGERAKRKSGQWIYLCSCAHGERCIAEKWSRRRRDGGNDHGDELCRGSDGDVRRDGGDERGGGEKLQDYGDDAGGECGGGDGNGNGQWAERKSDQWVHLRCAADGERRF